MKLPKKFSPILFGFFLSGLMTLFVTGISIALAVGVHDGFFAIWMRNWATIWVIAFPVVLFVAPLVRRLVSAMVET